MTISSSSSSSRTQTAAPVPRYTTTTPALGRNYTKWDLRSLDALVQMEEKAPEAYDTFLRNLADTIGVRIEHLHAMLQRSLPKHHHNCLEQVARVLAAEGYYTAARKLIAWYLDIDDRVRAYTVPPSIREESNCAPVLAQCKKIWRNLIDGACVEGLVTTETGATLTTSAWQSQRDQLAKRWGLTPTEEVAINKRRVGIGEQLKGAAMEELAAKMESSTAGGLLSAWYVYYGPAYESGATVDEYTCEALEEGRGDEETEGAGGSSAAATAAETSRRGGLGRAAKKARADPAAGLKLLEKLTDFPSCQGGVSGLGTMLSSRRGAQRGMFIGLNPAVLTPQCGDSVFVTYSLDGSEWKVATVVAVYSFERKLVLHTQCPDRDEDIGLDTKAVKVYLCGEVKYLEYARVCGVPPAVLRCQT